MEKKRDMQKAIWEKFIQVTNIRDNTFWYIISDHVSETSPKLEGPITVSTWEV